MRQGPIFRTRRNTRERVRMWIGAILGAALIVAAFASADMPAY